MKHIEEYLKDVIKVEPLGELTTMDDNLYGMSGEMVYIDGKCSGIFISHADYVNWLEKQDEQNPKFRIGDTIKKESTGDIVIISDIDLKNREYRLSNTGFIPFKYEYLWELVEQKPTDNVEPKFKVGDWVASSAKNVYQVENIENYKYTLRHILGGSLCISFSNDELIKLWTIQDAKDGDVLVLETDEVEWVFIYKEIVTSSSEVPHDLLKYHFLLANNCCSWQGVCAMVTEGYEEYLKPATKEQRGLLFQKMKESGFKWENNQLKKIDNKDYVDLGLPSGTLWSKCNLGAEKETDLGLLFQWGDTKGYESVNEHQFSWEDYKFGSWDDLTKYNEKDTKLILENEDDPVFVATKGKFKTPTKEQLQELIDHTNHKWATIERVNGMKFWKKGTEEPTDGNSYIFIPAAGHCCNDYHYGVDSWGYVWSASRKVFDEGFAWTMKFSDRGGIDICSNCYCNGFSVRGVVVPRAETFDEIDDTDDGQPVDLGLPSGTKWMKSNIGATKPSGFGKFFQWGDTQGYSNIYEHEFNWGDYKWGTFDSIIKYNKNDHLTLLVSNDDSAFVATSGQAFMPTKDQVQELIDNTEHRWLRLANGINGMKFWKKGTEEPTESNSYIFIPAAGDCCDGNHSDLGSWGYIWSAYSDESIASSAWSMYFDADDVYVYHFTRCLGYSVRAVVNIKDKKNDKQL